jgi:hypothetical protein
MRKMLFLIFIFIVICSPAISTAVNCTFNVLKNLSCEPNSCEGFEGIYTFEPEPNPTVTGGPSSISEAALASGRLHITKKIMEIDGKDVTSEEDLAKANRDSSVMYQIEVYHSRLETLKNFIVEDYLPEGLKYDEELANNVTLVEYAGVLVAGSDSETISPMEKIKPRVDGRNITFDRLPDLNKDVTAYIFVYATVEKDFGDEKANILKENQAKAKGEMDSIPFEDIAKAVANTVE